MAAKIEYFNQRLTNNLLPGLFIHFVCFLLAASTLKYKYIFLQ